MAVIHAGYVPFPTYLFLECMDETEYSALSSSQKEIFKIIISSGAVDYGSTTNIRAKIEEMFPEGTTTRTNIDNLLTVDL